MNRIFHRIWKRRALWYMSYAVLYAYVYVYDYYLYSVLGLLVIEFVASFERIESNSRIPLSIKENPQSSAHIVEKFQFPHFSNGSKSYLLMQGDAKMWSMESGSGHRRQGLRLVSSLPSQLSSVWSVQLHMYWIWTCCCLTYTLLPKCFHYRYLFESKEFALPQKKESGRLYQRIFSFFFFGRLFFSLKGSIDRFPSKSASRHLSDFGLQRIRIASTNLRNIHPISISLSIIFRFIPEADLRLSLLLHRTAHLRDSYLKSTEES